MTGFKEPLEETYKLIERISSKSKGSIFSLFFMSDGYDNQWSKSEILKAVQKAASGLSSATFVEYGYYADRNLLTKMAEAAGGTLIFADGFDRYAPTFESNFQKKVSQRKVTVTLEGSPVNGFAYGVLGQDVLTFGADGDEVLVPEDLNQVFYLVEGKTNSSLLDLSDTTSEEASTALKGAYLAISQYAQRMQSDVVLQLLRAVGDVALIEQFSSCFGKQKYSEFVESAQKMALDAGLRYMRGFDPNKVPREDAFTVLELLQMLAADEGNRVLLDNPNFRYSRISRRRLDSSDQLNEEEQQKVKDLSAKLATEKNANKIKELNEEIAAIVSSKKAPLKFEATPCSDGYNISSLTFNEERPNISFLVRKSGRVDISSRLPEEFKGDKLGKIPEVFSTFVYRNYAVVQDGLVNMEVLPVKVSDKTLLAINEAIRSGKAPKEVITEVNGVTLLNLKVLPVINRRMVQQVSAKALFEKEYRLTKARAEQKVYNAYLKDKFPKKSEGFVALYGEAGAEWLKEQGFTNYSGFSPKSVQAESTDVYIGKELKVSLKGYSTIPSLNEFRKQAAKGKHNGPGSLMKPAVEAVEAFLASDVYATAKDQEGVLKAWLDGQAKATTKEVRGLLFELAETRFSVIVGQVWFSEFSSLDENSLVLDVEGVQLGCKVEQKEVEIKI